MKYLTKVVETYRLDSEDEGVRFEVTKIFNEEREPTDTIEVIYERNV